MITANDFFASRYNNSVQPVVKAIPTWHSKIEDEEPSSLSEYVFENVYLGPPNPDRFMIFAFASDGGTDTFGSALSVTLTSPESEFPETSCNKLTSIGTLNHSSMWICPMPIGTLGTVTVALEGLRNQGAGLYAIYVTGLHSISATSVGSDKTTGESVEESLDVLSGGVTISALSARVNRGNTHSIQKVGIKTFTQDTFFYPLSAYREGENASLGGVSQSPENVYLILDITVTDRLSANFVTLR